MYEAWLQREARDAAAIKAEEVIEVGGVPGAPLLPPLRFLHDDDVHGEALRGGWCEEWAGGTSSLLAASGLRVPYGLLNAGVTRVEHLSVRCELGTGGCR